MKLNRRQFLKQSALGVAGATLASESSISAPTILTSSRGNNMSKSTSQGELIFRPYFTQKGVGPHLLDWAYASDANWDAFHCNITASQEGVKISDTEGKKKSASMCAGTWRASDTSSSPLTTAGSFTSFLLRAKRRC